MSAIPKPFDSDAPEGVRRAIIRRNPKKLDDKEMVEATWGSDPRFGEGVSYRFVRSEGRSFPVNRCLVPASDFRMRVGSKRYRVTREDGNFFYLAAIWEPAMADWPLSFRIVTVAANAEVAPYQERHGTMIQRSQVMHWLDGTMPEAELLVTPSPRTFVVQEMGGAPVQTQMAL